MNDLHVVVGNGPLGRALADDLASKGVQVRVISRGGGSASKNIETVRVDATNSADLDGALLGATVVYQCAQPEYTRWAQEFPELQQGILDGAVRAGADLVIADNLYMYGDPGGSVITEASAEHPTTRKGRVRKAMADSALDAHRAGRLRVAVSRPSNYFGPGHDQSSKAIFGAAVNGKSMQFFGNMHVPHSLTFYPDAARAMATLGTTGLGWGSVWIPPTQPAITQQEFAALVWRSAGHTGSPRTAVVGRRTLAALGLVIPVVREALEMSYEYDMPFVVDSSRYESAFSVEPTPMDEAIRVTLESYDGARVVRA